jgi:hypothetical protein
MADDKPSSAVKGIRPFSRYAAELGVRQRTVASTQSFSTRANGRASPHQIG